MNTFPVPVSIAGRNGVVRPITGTNNSVVHASVDKFSLGELGVLPEFILLLKNLEVCD